MIVAFSRRRKLKGRRKVCSDRRQPAEVSLSTATQVVTLGPLHSSLWGCYHIDVPGRWGPSLGDTSVMCVNSVRRAMRFISVDTLISSPSQICLPYQGNSFNKKINYNSLICNKNKQKLWTYVELQFYECKNVHCISLTHRVGLGGVKSPDIDTVVTL